MKSTWTQLVLLTNLLITGFLCLTHIQNQTIQLDLSDQILKVRGLVVVDSFGVERVILGAPLPDPSFHGYRLSRGENAFVSGVMLYDSEGQERGGYVTDDNYGNIFLTLDSKSAQQALFLAEPQGAANLILWSRNGNRLMLGAGDEGVNLEVTQNGKPAKLVTENE